MYILIALIDHWSIYPPVYFFIFLKLGELERPQSSQEHSEDGAKIARTGDADGKARLASGMWLFYF